MLTFSISHVLLETQIGLDNLSVSPHKHFSFNKVFYEPSLPLPKLEVYYHAFLP